MWVKVRVRSRRARPMWKSGGRHDGRLEDGSLEGGGGGARHVGRGASRGRGGRDVSTAAKPRARQLADEPPRLQRATPRAAFANRQNERQEPEAEIRAAARRHIGQRGRRGDAARRRRIHVHRRSMGRCLQNRRPFRVARRPCVEDGPRPAKARPRPRRRAVEQPRDLHHQPRRPRCRHRPRQRQGRLGQEPSRPARSRAHRRAAGARELDIDRRVGRRPRRARLGGLARRPHRRIEVEDLFDSRARRARKRDLERQEQRLANRRRRVLCDGLLRPRDEPLLLGLGQSGARL